MRIFATSSVVLLLCAGCGPGAERDGKADGVPLLTDSAEATATLQRPLGARGFAVDAVLSSEGRHVAVTVRGRDGHAHVAVLRQGEDGFVLLGSEALLENVPPQRVSWPKLGEHDGFSYTHDIAVEGLVGTVVRSIEGDSLRLSYVDPGRICRPAELRDLDGDGTPELVSYPEEASGADCSSECHERLRGAFDGGPHWTAVHRWTGGEWVPAEAAFPHFYAGVADQYRRMHAWASGDESTCKERWMDTNVFARWAGRAQDLAGQR